MSKKLRVKFRLLAMAIALTISASVSCIAPAKAESCPDLRVVFARGSGGERWDDKNYLAFRDAIAEKLATTNLSYEFIDLDYPAIGIDNLEVLLGAYFGGGEAYEFGDSVKTGVRKLDEMVNSGSCSDTKYVLGGYSQGAMVISGALSSLNADRIVYATTFGDPKLYLPEGEGLIPAACRGENLSDYRIYVPDCQAYEGMLGTYKPYEPEALMGKVGTWCNKRDIFCSSHLSIGDHVAYVADDLYEDAAKVIFSKICKAFEIKNTVASPHDTAILIDSTWSMQPMINQYKAEALRLAKETFASGGRVALYDYRDLGDPYNPRKHCDFETCKPENFEVNLDEIIVGNGGDESESLLSAAFTVMNELEWKQGATKSLVILTDANYLEPDRDGTTFDDVVQLSKRIDPVNFYIITKPEYGDFYESLATATDGKVVTEFDELSLLTDYIMERYDSLPRVEESEARELPEITDVNTIEVSENEVQVSFKTTGGQTLVALNDAILGTTTETTFVIGELDTEARNVLTLVPLGDDVRGRSIEVVLPTAGRGKQDSFAIEPGVQNLLIKAPNTGRH